jgi:flagellar hook-length control protein FliK
MDAAPTINAAPASVKTDASGIVTAAGQIVGAGAAPSGPAGTAVPAAGPAAAVVGAATSVTATPAALAAVITAMHQGGHSSTVLRLDPPGLGSLSVHVALAPAGSASAQVNLLFVASTPQAAGVLNAGMDGLRTAMAAAGLTLGQAQVGQGGGQASGQGSQGGRQGNTPTATPEAAAGPTRADGGVSAYA